MGLDTLKLYDMEAVCRLLGVSRQAVYSYIDAGRLHPVRLGRRLRFAEEDLRRFLVASGLPEGCLPGGASEAPEDAPGQACFPTLPDSGKQDRYAGLAVLTPEGGNADTSPAGWLHFNNMNFINALRLGRQPGGAPMLPLETAEVERRFFELLDAAGWEARVEEEGRTGWRLTASDASGREIGRGDWDAFLRQARRELGFNPSEPSSPERG